MKKSEITRQKILDAGEKAFSEKGLFGSRVDEISADAGINKRMIYEHFGSKENLYIAVLEMVYRRMADTEKELLIRELNPIEAIKAVISHYFSFLSQNSSFVKMVMWENINEAQFLKQSEAGSIKGTAIEVMRSKIEQGIKLGLFRPDIDVVPVVVCINMFCFSCFSNVYTMANIMKTDFTDSSTLEIYRGIVTEMILNYLKK